MVQLCRNIAQEVNRLGLLRVEGLANRVAIESETIHETRDTRHNKSPVPILSDFLHRD